jgi:hypothetical protein
MFSALAAMALSDPLVMLAPAVASIVELIVAPA